ncbi:DNA excision repair protein ERCC-1 isoform X2 [Cryptomeria japonica]|uniref:DNA excision repair protein ERCC-1 isoform X2 n=1 Tax=Cryptomeria japonica TaxID=3369 RepID=UPI0027DA4BE2|nr:DNA excision repair protein ERCC-1 isoform X2 [Cryptomeria japonica]
MGTEKDQQQQELRNFLVRVPSHEEVSEKSGAQPLPSLFRPSSEPPASFTQAFSFVKNSEFYTPPPPPPPSSSNEASSSAGASLNSSLNIGVGPVSQGRNGIMVSRRQQGNPILKHIRNVRWAFADIIPDYVLGQNACALYISLRYHLLHPDYIYYRIREIQKSFKLRVVLCYVDVEDVIKPLHEVTRTALLHDCTLLCGWSVEECARYLETIKTYENKPADNILERTDNDYLSRLSSALTTVRRVNKNDVVSLGSAFGTLSGIIGASMEDLARCPGIGEHKVKRLYDAFHEPFRRVTKYSRSPMKTEVASQDKTENDDRTKESGRDKADEALEVKQPELSVQSALSLAYAKYGKKIAAQRDNGNKIEEPSDEGATSETCLEDNVCLQQSLWNLGKLHELKWLMLL